MIIIFLCLITAVLLFLLFMQRAELKRLSKQLKRIEGESSNELLHSGNSTVPAELINRINELLKELHKSKRLYIEKTHGIEQMLTNISHDLRTPLTSALGYINLLQEADLPDEERKREIEIVRQRLSRLEELIDSFFEFSKWISSDKKPDKTPLNLVETLQEAVAHYYDDLSGQNRRVEFCCRASKIIINSNYNMLLRIFDNLIVNAYRHGIGDIKISVTQGECLLLRFENKMQRAEIDTGRIFDEFYTADIARTSGNTGLGLAIAKQFTRMLDGEIYAEYENDIFAVNIKFPAADCRIDNDGSSHF